MMPAPHRHASLPPVEIQVKSALWNAEPRAEDIARAAVLAAADMLSTAPGEVSIVLTDDSDMQELNRTWRGVDKPTNVLSFPAPKGDAGAMLGDIVVAYETVARECEDEERIFLHHLAHLTVHGFLHLVGYDHQTDADAEAMETLESKIMARMNMPDPYLARDPG
jgi:probable rRNA maturation factor